MNLVELIQMIESVDDRLIIYQKEQLSIDSSVHLFTEDECNGQIVVTDVDQYLYLLEVHLAKELIEDFLQAHTVRPSDLEIAERVLHYGIYDC